jgi:hypothetical protein
MVVPGIARQAKLVAVEDAFRNADYPWDLFDSEWYLRRNYRTLRDDDRAIIEVIANFFATYAPTRHWHGIDVGSGTNLYPSLAILPLADTVTLWEYSEANVRWLEHGIRPYSESWDLFWEAFRGSARVYDRLRRPRSILRERAKIQKASIFDLPEAQWDIGTMFFVAESITSDRAEFELATMKFIRSLKPGAPFAAAFMRNSLGYQVGAQWFPAVSIVESDIRRLLYDGTVDLRIHLISSREPIRHGYDGMILVTGTRGNATKRWNPTAGVGR